MDDVKTSIDHLIVSKHLSFIIGNKHLNLEESIGIHRSPLVSSPMSFPWHFFIASLHLRNGMNPWRLPRPFFCGGFDVFFG